MQKIEGEFTNLDSLSIKPLLLNFLEEKANLSSIIYHPISKKNDANDNVNFDTKSQFDTSKIKREIDQCIINKKPIFLSRYSTNPQSQNKLNACISSVYEKWRNPLIWEDFTGRKHLEHLKLEYNKDIVSYSSIALINNNLEVILVPISFSFSVYPIGYKNDSLLICTRSPLINNDYYDFDQIKQEDIVLIDVNNAIKNNELDIEPSEFNKLFFKEYLSLIKSRYQLNKITLSCIVENILKMYKWIDEFTYNEYFKRYTKEMSPIYQKVLENNSTSDTSPLCYIDLKIKVDEYDFNEGKYRFLIEGMSGYSDFFYKNNFNISFRLFNHDVFINKETFCKKDQSNNEFNNWYYESGKEYWFIPYGYGITSENLKLKEAKINYNNLNDKFSKKKISNKEYFENINSIRDIINNKYMKYLEIKMNEEDAKSIYSKLNQDKSINLKLFLENTPSSNYVIQCNQINNIEILYKVKNYTFERLNDD